MYILPDMLKHKENLDRVSELVNQETSDVMDVGEAEKRREYIRNAFKEIDEMEFYNAYLK